jgi:hypothetical protein
MVPKWKRWLGAAAVLLLAGAGCQAATRQDASLDAGADVSGETQDNGKVDVDVDAGASSSIESDADAAVDAAIGESDADADVSDEEDADADVMNNDSAELNAYGQTYVESETR